LFLIPRYYLKRFICLAFKLPLEEDTYVEFLKLLGVPIMERECSDDTVNTFCIILVTSKVALAYARAFYLLY
jgi:hypothetical protein